MRDYSQYSNEVRGEALRRLKVRDNLYCWLPSFDTNSDRVRSECQAVEDGKPIDWRPRLPMDKPLYTPRLGPDHGVVQLQNLHKYRYYRATGEHASLTLSQIEAIENQVKKDLHLHVPAPCNLDDPKECAVWCIETTLERLFQAEL